MKKVFIVVIGFILSQQAYATKIWGGNDRSFPYILEVVSESNPNDIWRIKLNPHEFPGESKAINVGCVGEIRVRYGQNFSKSKRLYTGGDLDKLGQRGGRCDGFFYVVLPNPAGFENREEPMSTELHWN